MRPICTARLRAGVRLTTLTLAATTAATIATTAATTAAPSAPAGLSSAARTWSVRVHRGGHDAVIRFHRHRAGEAFVSAAVSARGISWARRKNDSAVVSAYVDGHYATDVVITSAGPVVRQFALGRLKAGRHTLRMHYAARRSRSRAGVARLQGIRFSTVPATSPAYAAARFAPVLYGRNIKELGGPFQNNRTDTPLVAWHQVLPAATPGHSVIEYSVMWSNEDGGTNTAGLMAKWGRTTDIEWVYRVEVDAHGRRVPGSGVYQAPLHQTGKFRGTYDGTHPLLQTCTVNNTVCDRKALTALHQVEDPMRFALSTRSVLPAGRPREYEMDVHPWTYRVMGREMVREKKIERPSDPATLAVGDQRTYLYVTVARDTTPPASAGGVGLAVDVRLKGDPTTYTSDHLALPVLYTVNRDGPAATTVELPDGTTKADVESIAVRRVPIGTDNGAPLTVTDLGRAFFLGTGYRPRPSFAQWHGSVLLQVGVPTAQLWTAS